MKRYFPGIKKIISAKDIVVKVICVLLSVILWAYISSTNTGELKFKIPVTFENLPDTLIMSKAANRYVTVTLSGKKDTLKNTNIKSIKALVNLGQPEIGVYRNYPIEVIRDEIPENIDLSLSIKDVNLIIERRAYKKVKVRAKIVDRVMDGYVLGGITIIPDTVTINGPESLVKSIDYVQTERISIANASGRIVKDISINNKDSSDINIDISRVRVIIPVVESHSLSEFNKEIILRNINNEYKYILSQEEISVYLQSDNPNRELSQDDVDVFIDIGLMGPEEFFKISSESYVEKSFPVEAVSKREGVKVISIFPDSVSVRIMEK